MKKFVIRWKSKVNGRVGQGQKHFDRAEAETLATELNAEFPEIEHVVVEAPEVMPESVREQPEHAMAD